MSDYTIGHVFTDFSDGSEGYPRGGTIIFVTVMKGKRKVAVLVLPFRAGYLDGVDGAEKLTDAGMAAFHALMQDLAFWDLGVYAGQT